MKARSRLLAAAIGLSLALLAAWALQQRHQAAKAERKAVWMEYLQGPLSDLLYGSTRLRPLLLKKKLSKAEHAEAVDAVEHLRLASEGAFRLGQRSQKDERLRALASSAQWPGQIYDLMSVWGPLQGTPLGRQALAVEADMRVTLWNRLKSQREVMLAEKSMNKEEVLEMNALIYSLQEDTKALQK